MKRKLLLSAALMMGIGAAQAAPPPVSDWAPDESILVAAKAEGPAYWHIKKGASEIYILGTVGDIPKDLAWSSGYTASVIKGARVVLTPPMASSGFFSTTWFLLTHRSLLSMPDGKKLLDTLPPDLKKRFVAVVTDLHGPLDEMADDPPIIAAVKLENGFATTAKLSGEEPGKTVEKLARQNHVPVQRIAEYDALGLVKEVLRLPQEAQQACLREAVGDVEQRLVHARPVAEAWAVGDVGSIKAHYSPRVFSECAKATASFNRLYEQAVADYLKAINDALATPGKTVLITDIGSLLRGTGVAEKLHDQGVLVEGAAE